MREPARAPGRAGLPVALAFAAAFILRAVAGSVLAYGHRGARGFDFYGFMADNLLAGKGLSWAFYEGLGQKYANRGPLYPLLLAGIRAGAGGPSRAAEIVLQALVGTAAIAVPWLLARRWGGSRAGLVALWAAALWPYSVVTDTALIEHVLYAPLCGLTLWALLEAGDPGPRGARGALLAGAAAGLATLARLTFLASVPFLVVAAWRRVGLRRTVLAGAALGVVLLPWLVHNHRHVGHWVVGTDGGRAMLVGNHPVTFEHYPAFSIDEGERELYRRLGPATMDGLRALNDDEVAQDAAFRDLAHATIAADPAGAAWRMVRKAAALWSPVYNPAPAGAARLFVFAATFLPLLAAACAAVAVQPRLRADLPVVFGLLLSFTVVSALFWGQPRYLAPLHGIGIAAAAAWATRRPAPAA